MGIRKALKVIGRCQRREGYRPDVVQRAMRRMIAWVAGWRP